MLGLINKNQKNSFQIPTQTTMKEREKKNANKQGEFRFLYK
jgi:hypothetical protein